MAEARQDSLWAKSIPALIGLLGVLIGALTTSGIAYLGDRHRRSDDRRAAIRVVALEVKTDQLALLDFLRYGRTPKKPPLTTTAWSEERGTLAQYLSQDAWRAVANFYLVLQAAEPALTSQRCLPPGRRDDFVRRPFKHANEAVAALRVYNPLRLPRDSRFERSCPRKRVT
jgi:hypothetical protein